MSRMLRFAYFGRCSEDNLSSTSICMWAVRATVSGTDRFYLASISCKQLGPPILMKSTNVQTLGTSALHHTAYNTNTHALKLAMPRGV